MNTDHKANKPYFARDVMHNTHTAQLCVFDNRLASAWIQQATSALGLVAEIAENIAARESIETLGIKILTYPTIVPPTIYKHVTNSRNIKQVVDKQS